MLEKQARSDRDQIQLSITVKIAHDHHGRRGTTPQTVGNLALEGPVAVSEWHSAIAKHRPRVSEENSGRSRA